MSTEAESAGRAGPAQPRRARAGRPVPFPYRDSQFDLVLVTSVFTHPLTADAEHYLAEIARVLGPQGRLFSTWFVLDDERTDAGAQPMIDFAHHDGDALVADPNAPPAAVAYPRAWLQTAVESAGLTLRPTVRGSWIATNGPTPQDIVLATAA